MPRKSANTASIASSLKPKTPRNEDDNENDASKDPKAEMPPDTRTFPDYQVTPPIPLTKREKEEVANYRMFRDLMQRGPLHSVIGDDVRVSKYKSSGLAGSIVTDPFDGVETYSRRYIVAKKTLPDFSGRSHTLKFFPKELWSILDPKLSSKGGASGKHKRKRSQLSSATIERIEAEASGEQGDQKDEEGEDGEEDPNAKNPEDDKDDEYATDEDDMEGDYNAEGYFDDGGEDAGDDYDAGDGGDEEYY